jgi:hypothetical protein
LLFFRNLSARSRGTQVRTCDDFLFGEWQVLVSETLFLQYVGFENKGPVREYAFTLRGPGGKSSEYFVTIANAAFAAHRVRYQDGPQICSLRLQREFALRTDHSPSTRFSVTDAELAEYINARLPKPGASAYKKDEEF